MADDVFIAVGAPLPRIESARFIDAMDVEITWKGGVVQTIDLTPAIVGHRHFVRLRSDPDAFAKFVVSETADSLVWENGEELSAVWLEELAPASLGNAEFRQAMDELSFSLDGMAARLGIARRLIADYRKDKPIPPSIAMATRYLVERHRRAG
jgi:hypothetical protein